MAPRRQVVGAVYNWATCLFVTVMVYSQFFGALLSSHKTSYTTELGPNPTSGPYATGKTNDVPYADRLLACVRKSDGYQAKQLSGLLDPAAPTSSIIDTTGASIAGYRVLNRTGATLDSETQVVYSHVCQVASSTKAAIANVCDSLGYNVTRDGLRIVDGINSNVTRFVHNSLPLLIIPFFDNSYSARFVVPGWDGGACVLRLTGAYADASDPVAVVRGMNRSFREEKTIEWLRRPGGQWRNGWYEDAGGMRWYSDIMTTGVGRELPTAKYVDAFTGKQIDCASSRYCVLITTSQWGPKFISTKTTRYATSVVVFNGTQFGLYWYKAGLTTVVRSVYDWQTALSNATVALLIFRWTVSLVALHRGFLDGKCSLHHTGIGALSNSMSFQSLPIVLLPRMTLALCAFFSVGCSFQGQQAGFAETWFAIYPAITELTLFYYSLLNAVAKVLRRRMTDALFAPTILVLSVMHFHRREIARWHWLGLKEGFITALVTSDEMDKLRLHHFFTTDVALRLNGNITRLFALKLAVLGLSLVPLVIAKPLPVQRDLVKSLSGIEKALAVRASNVGGLGQAHSYKLEVDGKLKATASKADAVHPTGRLALNSYEVIRLGCVVYGDKYLITMDDWDRVSMLAGFRHFYHLWNHRVAVFELRECQDGSSLEVTSHPRLVRVDAPELQAVSIWRISARSLSC